MRPRDLLRRLKRLGLLQRSLRHRRHRHVGSDLVLGSHLLGWLRSHDLRLGSYLLGFQWSNDLLSVVL